jgi:hypothetical protein
MKRQKQIVVAIFILVGILMAIFTFGKGLRLVRDSQLSGVEVEEKLPQLTLRSLWEGAWQKDLEKWLAKKLFLRSVLVRIDNQINYSLFDEISSKAGDEKLILGVDKWLFVKDYIDHFNKWGAVPLPVLEGKVQSIRKLQTILENHGIPFLFVITPSKASIYPEYIDRKYLVANSQEKESNYEKLVPLFNRYRIKYLDGHRLFVELKKKSPYLLYPQSGIHWNYYSAYLVTVELISTLTKMLNKKLVTLRSEDIEVSTTPRGADNDLALLSNILFTKSLYGQYPYPKIAPSPNQKTAFRPKVLFVGASYLNNVLDYMDKYEIYRERVFYYYHKTKRFFPEKPETPVDKDMKSLRNEILAQDVIVVETNESAIWEIGFGFVEDALKALDPVRD